jgi:uncharacterized protein
MVRRMRALRKAVLVSLVIELVCAGLLCLGERGYLPGRLDVLALVAMLLQLGSVLLTCGRWADRLPVVEFVGIMFLVQWLVWIVIVYLFLLVQEYCRRRRTPAWVKLSAAAAVVGIAILLVSQWKYPPPAYASTRPPRTPPGVTVKSVADNGLDADFFHRASSEPQKAVILLGGSEGGKSWSDATDFIQQLVDEGCCVLSLAYFGTEGLPSQLQNVPLEYFPKAFRWLAAQKDIVVPDDYAVVGGSRGAELALLVGSRFREVKAVVAISPSSVVFQGSPVSKWDGLRGRHSSWSWNGQELAFVPAAYSWGALRGLITGKYLRMFEQELRISRCLKEAAIPVEQTQGPILLASFTRDEVWPSTVMSEQVMQRLHDRRFRFHYEHTAYDAGHCQWWITRCRTQILTFLKERFLTAPRDRLPPTSGQTAESGGGDAAAEVTAANGASRCR